jgi:hypothetical protein
MIFLSFYYAEQEVTAAVIAVKRSNYRLSLSRPAPLQVNTPRQAGVVSREQEIVRTASSSSPVLRASSPCRLQSLSRGSVPSDTARNGWTASASCPLYGLSFLHCFLPSWRSPSRTSLCIPGRWGPRSLAPSTALAPLPDDQISCSASPAHTKQTPPVHL